MACCFKRNHVYCLLQTQVVAFLYTAMRGIDLGLRTTPIVTPVNVLHNWRHEFKKWIPGELKRLDIFMLEDVPRSRKAIATCKIFLARSRKAIATCKSFKKKDLS